MKTIDSTLPDALGRWSFSKLPVRFSLPQLEEGEVMPIHRSMQAGDGRARELQLLLLAAKEAAAREGGKS
jgi:hypothetical protein